jgi:hypothetical protein
MDSRAKQSGVCFAFQNNECTRGNKCIFQHERQTYDEESKKRRRDDTDLANVLNNHPGVVLLGDRAIAESAPVFEPPVKLKKPKHLKRKLENAALITDVVARSEEVLKIQTEKEELGEFKKNAAKMWKKTCQKLVKRSLGEDKWDEEKFQSLVAAKVGKETFLKALGVPADELKE